MTAGGVFAGGKQREPQSPLPRRVRPPRPWSEHPQHRRAGVRATASARNAPARTWSQVERYRVDNPATLGQRSGSVIARRRAAIGDVDQVDSGASLNCSGSPCERGSPRLASICQRSRLRLRRRNQLLHRMYGPSFSIPAAGWRLGPRVQPARNPFQDCTAIWDDHRPDRDVRGMAQQQRCIHRAATSPPRSAPIVPVATELFSTTTGWPAALLQSLSEGPCKKIVSRPVRRRPECGWVLLG